MVERAPAQTVEQPAPAPPTMVTVQYNCDDHPEIVWTKTIPRGVPIPLAFCSACGIAMRGTVAN